MEEVPNKVLVVTPHPDDAEIWGGGTIASWVKQGAEVHYLLCTNREWNWRCSAYL